MSWSVNGREYHNYNDYLAAKEKNDRSRLRRAVERLTIPTADTSSLEARLATAQVRKEALSSLTEKMERDTSGREQQLRELGTHLNEAAGEAARREAEIRSTLSSASQQLESQIRSLDQLRVQREAEARSTLERELEQDRVADRQTESRTQHLLMESGRILAEQKREQLERLGLEQGTLVDLLDRAKKAHGAEGLELARRSYEKAIALDSEARFRAARLEAMRAIFLEELQDLKNSLSFTPEDRADLVGEGGQALDAPLRQGLDRLEAKVAQIDRYEDHEARFAALRQALVPLAERTLELSSQVEDFQKLEDDRFDLVKNRLAERLSNVLGKKVSLLQVDGGKLGLQPVEARFAVAGGEIVDCSVAIDGTLRVHHHGHADQAACAEAATRMATELPNLIQMAEQPRLDIADGLSGSLNQDKAGSGSLDGVKQQ